MLFTPSLETILFIETLSEATDCDLYLLKEAIQKRVYSKSTTEKKTTIVNSVT